ncbi:MAG: glycosyltransferase family 2 protein, partial [Anaerolineae bacterium]
GSTDGSREWLRSLQNHRFHGIFAPQNLGFAAGCNLGIQEARGDYLLLLNTDAFPRSGAISKLVTYIKRNPDVGIVGPQLIYPDGRWQRSTGRIPSPYAAFLDAMTLTSVQHLLSAALWRSTGRWWRPHLVEYVDGACMLIRQRVVEEIGDLDERFFFFVEDAEFCDRARRHGWKVVHVPQSQVVHLRGGSSSKKNYERAVRARMLSEEIFVRDSQGERAWHRFVFWRRVNFWWRMQWASLWGMRERYAKYEQTYRIYAESAR